MINTTLTCEEDVKKGDVIAINPETGCMRKVNLPPDIKRTYIEREPIERKIHKLSEEIKDFKTTMKDTIEAYNAHMAIYDTQKLDDLIIRRDALYWAINSKGLPPEQHALTGTFYFNPNRLTEYNERMKK